MSDQLATDIRGIVDGGAPPITLAELELASLTGTPPRRHRRWPVLAAAAAAAALIVATIILVRTASNDGGTVLTPAGPAPSAPAPAPPAPAPTPLGAPLVQGPDPASTLLTSWSQFHVGYIFVYADGRVLFYPDIGAVLPKDVTRYEINERHLSPRGLDLVRAGKLDPKYVLVGSQTYRYQRPYSRKKLWVEPTARLWEPTAYALCPITEGGIRSIFVNATDIVDELPAPVRAVLDGKQRTYDPTIGTAHWKFPGPPEEKFGDCFELTAAETSTLYQIIDANGLFNYDQETISGPQGWNRVFHYGNLSLTPEPIFPHGQWVGWGG